MNLRDHSRPCEHERNWAYKEDRGWMCGDIDCPGGAAVPIDYEAATAAWFKGHVDIKGIIDAALGLTDA